MGNINWLLATRNPGKVLELHQILGDYPIRVKSLEDLTVQGDSPETGKTFLENAMQKADFYYQLTNTPVLADDSGLEVDALNGAPGIHSARFGGVSSDTERIDYLLGLLDDVPDEFRTARFRCAAVFYDGWRYLSAEGGLEGYISHKPSGSNGFGYDPIFHPVLSGPSLAEYEPAEKNHISHRSQAFRALVQAILKLNEANV